MQGSVVTAQKRAGSCNRRPGELGPEALIPSSVVLLCPGQVIHLGHSVLASPFLTFASAFASLKYSLLPVSSGC